MKRILCLLLLAALCLSSALAEETGAVTVGTQTQRGFVNDNVLHADIGYVEDMIVLSPQLNDWGETSADMAIALTEYFLANYNIDPQRVYLHGMSGGGETASLVLGKRPELYTACLVTSSQWDGDLQTLAEARTPVYLAIGAQDSYYGADSFEDTCVALRALYKAQGLSAEEIDRLVVLDVREQEFFTERGFTDQHAGGQAFAHEPGVMGWLFGEH